MDSRRHPLWFFRREPSKWLIERENSPVDLFELFYDTEIISLICDMTNPYAYQTLLICGYSPVPRVRLYWEQAPDQQPSDLDSHRNLHVWYNSNLDNDKFAKVSPLCQKLNERWLEYFYGEINLCVDEATLESTVLNIIAKASRFAKDIKPLITVRLPDTKCVVCRSKYWQQFLSLVDQLLQNLGIRLRQKQNLIFK
uniref:PiggyBac transposable element-derived protein domain-containing protein n=1 Tax=Timema genevievae TaxID=629358 RepID=A0A7R9K947_TIMGE|nr:unnamed protein product [Timema genevievae]